MVRDVHKHLTQLVWPIYFHVRSYDGEQTKFCPFFQFNCQIDSNLGLGSIPFMQCLFVHHHPLSSGRVGATQ